MSPISSRNSVPSCAISKAPMRSARVGECALYVTEEFAFEQRCGKSRGVHRDEWTCARGERTCSARATTSLPVPCSPVTSTLASDLATLSSVSSTAFIAGRVCRAKLAVRSAAEIDFRFRDDDSASFLGGEHRVCTYCGHETRVVPGLLHVVARAAAHRLHRAFDGAPGGHLDRWAARAAMVRMPVEKSETLTARGRVARVVEIDKSLITKSRAAKDDSAAAGEVTLSTA